MKKIYFMFCLLLVGTITLTASPIKTKAADSACYFCPNDSVYIWSSDSKETKNCNKVSISTQEKCIDENIADEDDFIGTVSCGGTGFEFHRSLPNFTSTIYDILKIITPVIIVITGMLDMLKAVSAQKEDDIKKSQQKFVRRLLAGAIVFLVFVIVEAAIHFVAQGDDANNAMKCVNCFLQGAENCKN